MSKTARVTLVLPKGLWDDVKRIVPAGQRSRLVAEALEAEVRRRKRIEQLRNLEQFQDYMRGKYNELPYGAEDIEQMRQERDHELTDLR